MQSLLPEKQPNKTEIARLKYTIGRSNFVTLMRIGMQTYLIVAHIDTRMERIQSMLVRFGVMAYTLKQGQYIYFLVYRTFLFACYTLDTPPEGFYASF